MKDKNEKTDPDKLLAKDENEFRSVFSGKIVIITTFSIVFLFILLIAVQFGKGFWLNIALNHFPAVIGLPAAAAGAFTVVVLLRNTEGPIEFEGLGFKFKGASGPVILWALCFLVISVAINMLWPLNTNLG